MNIIDDIGILQNIAKWFLEWERLFEDISRLYKILNSYQKGISFKIQIFKNKYFIVCIYLRKLMKIIADSLLDCSKTSSLEGIANTLNLLGFKCFCSCLSRLAFNLWWNGSYIGLNGLFIST